MGVSVIISILKTGKLNPDKLGYLHNVLSEMVEPNQKWALDSQTVIYSFNHSHYCLDLNIVSILYHPDPIKF